LPEKLKAEKLKAMNPFDASFIASPAVAGNAIILLSHTHLYHIAATHD